MQVKLPDAAKTLILKLARTETVAALRALIDRQRVLVSEIPESYELFSAYPPRVISDGSQTMEDACLVPNATLFLRGVGSATLL
jgi:hypothetical protein